MGKNVQGHDIKKNNYKMFNIDTELTKDDSKLFHIIVSYFYICIKYPIA